MLRDIAGEQEVGLPHPVPAEMIPKSPRLWPSRKAKTPSIYGQWVSSLHSLVSQVSECIKKTRTGMEIRSFRMKVMLRLFPGVN